MEQVTSTPESQVTEQLSTEPAPVETAQTSAIPNPVKEEATGLEKLKAKAAKAADIVVDPSITAPAAEKPVFTPNFKFKAGGKEMEFDDFIRPIIKDADTEKKLREMYEKAHGLPSIKSERDRVLEEYKGLKGEYTGLTEGLDHLSTLVSKKDYHGFFNALGIPEQDVLQYALSRVQYKELPPEQRQQMDAQYQASQRLEYLERANQELLQTYQTQQVSQRSAELEGYLQRPEIAQITSAFDARMGPGAFKNEVIRRGQYYASLPQAQDITVEQAVNEIMSLVGPVAPQQAPAPQIEPPQAVQQHQMKPVIPNIKGRGTSPAKKIVRSISDLRKEAASHND
jgi:hypothetical protein